MMNPIYLQFAETPDEGNIRKWSCNPFEGGVRYEAAMAWQPIETAPRDGTDFLVNCKEVMSDCTMASYKDGVLVSSWNGKPFSPDVTPPTHCMPLPPAPEHDA